MVQRNRTRMDYLEKFQQMIEDYNTGSVNVDITFDSLLRFVDDLETEEQRSIAENLTEEELAIFDLLTQPKLSLTDKECDHVKRIARDLLEALKREKLILDWQKRQNTKLFDIVSVSCWINYQNALQKSSMIKNVKLCTNTLNMLTLEMARASMIPLHELDCLKSCA